MLTIWPANTVASSYISAFDSTMYNAYAVERTLLSTELRRVTADERGLYQSSLTVKANIRYPTSAVPKIGQSQDQDGTPAAVMMCGTSQLGIRQSRICWEEGDLTGCQNFPKG